MASYLTYSILRTVGLVALFLQTAWSNTSTPPHIVYILADDLGWNDVSFHGSPQIPTPNIDALASAGVVLQNLYMAPQCTPSRASLMTGRYPPNTGLQHFVIRGGQPNGLPLTFKILPQYLKDLGYSTALVGKWHLGYFKKEYTPLYRGFDYFFGYLNGMIDYYDYTYYYPGSDKLLYGIDFYDGTKVVRNFRGRYATDVFTDKAIDVIENHNSSEPLFLLLSQIAPHTGNRFLPFQAPPEDVAKFKHIKDKQRRTYAGKIARLDESVGQVFLALDRRGMLNNSIVIFSSDNGGPTADVRGGASSNWPLRGQKMQLWEGGVRVPALVWSPLLQLLEPRTTNALMHVSDWLPTLYHAAGGDISDIGNIDGMNMWPHIQAGLPSPRTEILLNIDPVLNMSALRVGDYKLVKGYNPEKPDIWYGPSGRDEISLKSTLDEWVWKDGSEVRDVLIKNGWWLVTEPDVWRANLTVQCHKTSGTPCNPSAAPCLFNLAKDPCEYDNVADRFPEIVHDLNEQIIVFESSAMDALNDPIDPKADPACHGFAFVSWRDEEHDSDCPYDSP